MITGKNFIGNNLSAKGTKIFKSYNALEQIYSELEFNCATLNEVNESVELAKNAFHIYKNFSGKRKAEFLNAIADEILNLGDELVSNAMKETALPEGRILGERGRTVNQLKMFANLLEEGSWVEASIDTSMPEREPVPKPDIRKFRTAIGPVVVFGASNFPLAFSTAGGDTASALAAGCPVIVKSHPSHPATGELVASAIINAAKKTNMPNGVFSFLNDSGYDVAKQLVKHPEIKSVAFTGSFNGGKALFDLANQREEPVPVFAEMGSVNPVFILPEKLNADYQNLATGLAGSITLGVGQFCTNPGLIIVQESEDLRKFTSKLSDLIQTSEAGKMLNANITANYIQKRNNLFKEKEINIEGNAAVIEGLANPTVVSVTANTFISNPHLHEEVFGPFSMIVVCKNNNEMINVADSLQGQLTATIQTKENEVSSYNELVDKIKAKVGRLIFNGVPTGVEVCPSMQHGGPFPATTDSRFTSVGTDAIKRFTRPLAFQDCPNNILPDELKNENPLNIWRLVNNNFTKDKI